VDANVFLRFFTRDDAPQQKRSEELFKAASAGELALITGPPVLFEVAWTLRVSYDLPREKVLEILMNISSLKGLKLLDRDLLDAALQSMGKHGQEFADAYIQAAAHAADACIATFNRKDFVKAGAVLHEF
jgi:predicted nucleic acid-binding protein